MMYIIHDGAIYFTDWLKAAQSFSILGLFAMIGAVALTVVYAFVPDMEGELKVLGASIATLATTGRSCY